MFALSPGSSSRIFLPDFSGGIKGICPGTAALPTVMSNHGAENIGDPNATFGVTEGNPLWEELRDVALRVGPSFVLNVTLNEQRQITSVFAGDIIKAHKVGTEFVRQSAMQRVEAPFDVVVTTNSGYPLDMNLVSRREGDERRRADHQARRHADPRRECREGVPADSPFDKLLRSASNPEEILAMLATPGFVRPEQWQAQIQALVQRKARVLRLQLAAGRGRPRCSFHSLS